MHEFSIANSLVEIATEHATNAGAEKINAVTLRIGALSCVHKNALEFSFELITKDTILEGAQLEVIDVPVTIFCAPCDKEVALDGIQCFRCPTCDTPSADIRHGRELDIDSIEITEMNKTIVSQPT
jgi:hydrogenase nickel incorporation protein HypA/HybF